MNAVSWLLLLSASVPPLYCIAFQLISHISIISVPVVIWAIIPAFKEYWWKFQDKSLEREHDESYTASQISLFKDGCEYSLIISLFLDILLFCHTNLTTILTYFFSYIMMGNLRLGLNNLPKDPELIGSRGKV